ncbi:threonine--tRNA ligase [Lactobacillus delbrueckii]|uniref:Threonine--tRNA ligase n=1 Tax=Lactobacillus delbrueckii subsp. bulgaricus TaxID=1585 RepID=A0AAV5PE05_LACDE|nr:threonine--tRNA ligase [Lactobacillus delbrueckii]ADY85476.1 Threonyl-tRNA synthetase [Lactobacillus delbrueckii subsp. bulgaricus 2038]ABJ58914.1 threonyl-tRNA synthetase / Ser-tRNA(Thr) hydrolase [Lactobacillus delbrueckii subsp. bulgaricus ATCC BAA-365]EHE91446.1 Threonine--tRNA ligase [Lactobacillus delbrueckii subsp. bulgaricus CNCM I-1632]MBS4915358.1 threonine--tRNA ligase [Lactobacillus delbrueckii]MBT8799796.1 threonine--tRNA ligase [Lactobacillus delbrueckii subsp. bulgaricus]
MSFALILPDGSKKEFDAAVSVADLASSISTSLAKNAVAGKVDGEIKPLDFQLDTDHEVAILTNKDAEGLSVLRATVAFVLEALVKDKYPEIKLGQAEVSEDGFFIETDKEDQIKVTELPDLEKALQKAIKNGEAIEHVQVAKSELAEAFKDDPYKSELLAKEGDVVDAYKLGDFVDFGFSALLPNTGKIKKFKLLSVAGAYWKGKSSNPMLQRIFGTAFFKEADLEADLKRRAEIKERDHRTIGRDLDLFFVDPKAGAGLPYWMPKGATIRRIIERYIVDKEVAAGYQHVYTPVLMNLDAYKTSGHWAHYREDMFPPMDMGEGEMLELRPMNCPSHIQIYKHHIRSYRELPIRIAELGMMHRYEKSGALSGLQRVREMTLNDGHTFVALDQVQEEFARTLQIIMDVYHDFDINDYYFRLSYRDPKNTDKYFANDEMWERSQSMLKAAMDDMGLDYVEAEGEAAFYGPKLDIQTKTALGNDETMSTIQLDFMLPERFELSYIGADGEEHRPVMIHRGIVGTMERFIAYLTEIYKGAFPTWLAPVQAEIIPVNLDAHSDYAKKVRDELVAKGFRAEIDFRNEKLGYKIRESQTQKVPYTLVLGDDEMNAGTVNVRPYGTEEQNSESLAEFMDKLSKDVANYSRED